MSEEKGLTEYLNEYLSGGQVQLPVSNMTGLRLQQEISKEGADPKEIEKLIITDQALTAQVLKIANSAFYRGLHKASSVREALLRLGMVEVSNIITLVSQKQTFRAKDPSIGELLEKLWQHSVACAVGAQWLAKSCNFRRGGALSAPDRALLAREHRARRLRRLRERVGGGAPMRVYTTAPMEDPRDARRVFPRLEEIGYDGAFSFEAKLDPFLPLVLAAEHTRRLQLGTAIAIAFARNPMNLANLAWGVQTISEGRFWLGLGTQVRPHIEKRFGMPWSRPAARLREMVLAIRAIFARWEGKAELRFEGEFYRHTLMIPAFNPGPNPFGPPPIYTGGFGPRMTELAGEVADGFIAHPFQTRESLRRNCCRRSSGVSRRGGGAATGST